MKLIPLIPHSLALVDDKDFPLVASFGWYALNNKSGNTYAKGKVRGKLAAMHRLIMGARIGEYVDHINGNGLDNRRENLRIATPTQNNANQRQKKTKFKGVIAKPGKFLVRVWRSGKCFHGGTYRTEIEAAKAYNDLAVRIYGEFACLNNIQGEEGLI
jgi:hypothetical protein